MVGITFLLFVTVAILTEVNGINIEKTHRFKMLNLFGYTDYRVLIGQNAIVTSKSIVTIICEITTEPGDGVIIEWVFNGEDVIFNGFNSISLPNVIRYSEEELTITNTTTLHTGIYECVLRDVITGEELDRGMTKLEVLGECPDKCIGQQGNKGVTGRRGDVGKMGSSGLQGLCDPSICHEKGINGTKGINGAKGAIGENGAKGDNGENGEDATNGAVGDMGERGRQGEIGEKGEKGVNGENGEDGIDGEGGEEGVRGGKGEQGMKGEKGEEREMNVGPNGELGEKGEKGEMGEKGNIGTKGLQSDKGSPGGKGSSGIKGERGRKGERGKKGIIGQRIIISAINSIYNTNCTQYEKGQIIYDTVIGKFVFCDGTHFQCIKDKPCYPTCQEDELPFNTIASDVTTNCINLIYIIDESASMKEEQIWLKNVSNAIPEALALRNYDPGVCNNNFAILGFGTGEEKSRAEQIGRPIDLGGIIDQEGTVIPYWGNNEDVIRVINENPFQDEGRKEDGYAAIYRALQRYTFTGQACRKILLITDEDRDNETPSPDPPYDRVPTLFNKNMQQILTQFSITLSAVISIQFQAQDNQQPLINANTIIGLLPNNSVIYYDANMPSQFNTAPDGYVRKDSAAGNTEQTYFQMVRETGGIAWSLPASRTYREAFTNAFLEYEVIPHVTLNNTCKLDSCNRCICEDGNYDCKLIQSIDFNTTTQCRPTECNTTQVISGFRQPACVDMIFAVAETDTMQGAHIAIKDVATRLPSNLAKINFGQENSICPNKYCIMGYGAENERISDRCYSHPFLIPPQNKLCAPSSQLAPLIAGLGLTATGQQADGYSAVHTALQTYGSNFQSQSCRHITLITDTERFDCGSYTDGNSIIPQLNTNQIMADLQRANIVLNVIVNATFQDENGNEAIGIFQEIDGSITAVVPSSSAGLGYNLMPGGRVKEAGEKIEQDYIDLAIRLNGSAWNIRSMGEQTDLFTRAFVKAVVIKSSESCGQTRACVECKCIGGELQQCEESQLCAVPGFTPILAFISGNITIKEDGKLALVGGYGSNEEKVYYGLDGDLVSTFTISTRLREGTLPVNTSWFYVGDNGDYIPIEDSIVASYASVSETNQYNLVFSQVGDNIVGSYVLIAENEFGTDTQFTTIGILPKWDKTTSGTVTEGTEAQFGQTLVARTGSELRITGIVREGTRPWSFQWFYNGEELIQGVDYSLEYQGNIANIIIHNFTLELSGTYTTTVSNSFGNDTHIFNLIVQTTVSCDNNLADTVTMCSSCLYKNVTDEVILAFYMHSGRTAMNVTWYREDNLGARQEYASKALRLGSNHVALNYTEFCDYNYEVDVPYYNTIKFNCPVNSCLKNGKEIASCTNEKVWVQSCNPTSEPGVNVMLVLDVTTEMKPVNDFIFQILLPNLEKQLNKVCIGIGEERNEYTATRMSIDETEPEFIREDHFTFSPDNTTNLDKLYEEVTDLANDIGGRGGYGAVKLTLNNERVRPKNNRILILSTNKKSDMSIYSPSDWAEKSYFEIRNFQDRGRRLFTEALRDNNPIRELYPLLLINTNLTTNTRQNDTYSCIGASNLLQCYFKRNSTSVDRLRGSIINNVEGNEDMEAIHKDFVVPSLNAGGFVWDINAIINGGPEERQAISDTIIRSVVTRIRAGKCETCRCFYGGNAKCLPLNLPSTEEELCQCEQLNGAGNCECLNVDLSRSRGTDQSCQLIIS